MVKFAIRNPFKKKDKIINVNMLTEQNGIYHVIIRKNVQFGVTSLEYDGKKYIVDLNKAINDTDNIPMLFYIVGNAEPLVFAGVKFKDSKMFERITKSDIYSQYYTKSQQKIFVIMIVILIVGIVVIGMYALYSQNQLVQQLTKVVTK